MTPVDSTASPSLKKLFSNAESFDLRDEEQERRDDEEVIGYQSVEKSGLAMALQFEE